MAKLYLFVIINIIITFSLTNGDKINKLKVTKRLENGDILPGELWSEFSIKCSNNKRLSLEAKVPIHESNVNLYLANEDKNILMLNLSGPQLIGCRYETPYGKSEKLEGSDIYHDDGNILVDIPAKWLPNQVTRISASVEVEDDLYNYYGIFNRPISIADTMVVEEFRKVTLCEE